MEEIHLGVNVDHVATVRQARGAAYPSVIEAAQAAERGGASGITAHLREDRRHIQDADIEELQHAVATKLNLEMAVSDEIVALAARVRPADACIVPERREELTTEGGLSVAGNVPRIAEVVERLATAGIRVSLFIDPDPREIDATLETAATVIELHTGAYAEAGDGDARDSELTRIADAALYAASGGLTVNAGHGLTLDNVGAIARLPQLVELNIGHSIVARALMVGMEAATREMLAVCRQARGVHV